MLFKLALNILTVCCSTGLTSNSKKVVIITRDGCGYSKAMREMLIKNGIPYVDLNINKLNSDIRLITNYSNSTFPLVFENGKYIGGYSESTTHNFIKPVNNVNNDFNDSDMELDNFLKMNE
ncbi:hypothetical protein HERIO_1404 [Hepatospora eriocheir]|uniref:Glutaredoxin domain-containing protein n=1 Tax=Hepatospora eriocheir TaxID=1081669 RepID=A0A1X0QA47_9MICR|nr:hypothetical protein HERIO_1404 [Hepatospora eriocheir]